MLGARDCFPIGAVRHSDHDPHVNSHGLSPQSIVSFDGQGKPWCLLGVVMLTVRVCVKSPGVQSFGAQSFQKYSQSTLQSLSSSAGQSVPPFRADCVMVGARF
jgi:hypothetical protein